MKTASCLVIVSVAGAVAALVFGLATAAPIFISLEILAVAVADNARPRQPLMANAA